MISLGYKQSLQFKTKIQRGSGTLTTVYTPADISLYTYTRIFSFHKHHSSVRSLAQTW